MKTLPDWLTVSDTPDWDHLWAMPRDWPAMYAHTESDDPFWREHRQEISAALVSFGQRIVPRMLADLEAVEWEALSPGDLVVLWQQGMIARTALYDLSDAEDKDQDETIRRLYGMLVKEGVWLCAQHHATSPLAFAASVAAGHFPQGPLLAEISRRGEQHPPGFAAAIVRLCHALRARTGLSDLPSEISALAELEGRAKGHLQRRNKAAWARLREPIPMLEVAGQIPITVDKYWGGSDPLRVLAAALSGDLNVAPLKIASGL
jgi:hypothetical protein